MKRVLTFGEIMLRMSSPGHQRLRQASSFDATYGGGEANVAASLAQLGHDAAFITKVPAHAIGQAAVDHLRRYGVDTTAVVRSGDRLGIYFLEPGASVRPSQVIYDRAGSAISLADPDDFDFEAVLEGADWFHWSGITPALGERAQACVRAALSVARRLGITVSVDLNFRARLWTPTQAQRVMRPLMESVDYCIGNEEDAALSLGLRAGRTDVTRGQLDLDGYEEVLTRLVEEYGLQAAVTTLRESRGAGRNGWSALAFDGQLHTSERYDLDIVDRVGSGDAFAAGFIHGKLLGWSTAETLSFATAASALKHTVPGDFHVVEAEEVHRLAEGDRSGRVRR